MTNTKHIIHSQDLIHPDDDFTREWVTVDDWNEADRQLAAGENPSTVAERLQSWAREHAFVAEAETAEFVQNLLRECQ